jgi:hypothetical protein
MITFSGTVKAGSLFKEMFRNLFAKAFNLVIILSFINLLGLDLLVDVSNTILCLIDINRPYKCSFNFRN